MGFTLSDTYVIMTVSIKNCTNGDCFNQKGREKYAELTRQYIVLKAFLTSLGVTITELDLMKE